MNNIYLSYEGLESAAETMRGDETIHLGIRPYEMHDGNTLALVAYPIMLCEKLKSLGKIPQFNFILSLNDWEQDHLEGEDIYRYNFDVHPQHTTIQFLKDDSGQSTSVMWAARIREAFDELLKRFNKVRLTQVFNSSLKDNPIMKQVVLKTLKDSHKIKDLMLGSSGKETNHSDYGFANALCPFCTHANTNTVVEDDTIRLFCNRCKKQAQGKYENFWYWLHHKPLFAARWKIFSFPYSISGGDHYHEGDTKTRIVLYEFFFNEPAPQLNMIFSPVLLGHNGQKMSKSRNNYKSSNIETVLNCARQNYEMEICLYSYSSQNIRRAA